MSLPRITVVALAIALFAAPNISAEEPRTDDGVADYETPWEERSSRLSLGAGYPHVMHISYSYALLPSLRMTATYAGLAPFLFGGGLQVDYLLTSLRLGRRGFSTLSGGLQSLLMKYNFGVVGGIQPNDVDWGVGSELAIDVGYAWFSAGLGVGFLVGDWRSLKRDIGPDVTPSEHLAISFTVPRLAVSW